MDNQYYQPGTGYPPQQPAGQAPVGGMQVPPGYMPQMTGQAPVYPGNQMGQAGPMMPVPQGYMDAMQGYPQPGQTGYQTPVNSQMPVPGQVPMNGQTAGYQVVTQTGYQVPQGYQTYQQAPYGEAGFEHLFDHGQGMPYGQSGPDGQPMPSGQAMPNGQAMPEQPSGFPVQEYRPVRRRFRFHPAFAVLIVAVLAVTGFFVFRQMTPRGPQYAAIATGTLSASHAGDCLIVRNEAPYDSEGVTSITYEAEEGSAVIRKDLICKVYSSGYSTREMRTLQEYRSEIRDYQKKLIESETAYDARMNRVTSEVLTRVKEVRDLIGGARGSLGNQEKLLEAAVDARQQYLKEKYTADQRYSRLYDDELAQSQRIDSWTKEEVATAEGIVSFYSDGYEYGLNGTNYTAFEPHEVRAMINGRKPELTTLQKGKTTIYRMVKDGEWYVLFLSDDKTWNPVNGQVYNLQLERFENTVVQATVVSFTRSGGELLVRLKVSGSVKPVLYMRTGDAVLGENLAALMVDERAIHVQDGMTGVVVVDGQNKSFIPVNVIRYEGGQAYFQAIQQGLLFENMTVLLF